MPTLLELSPELVLTIASFLPQVDLLNVSLTCNRLRNFTEAELYREYNNTLMYGRSIVPFVKRLIEQPRLAKHVHRLDLRYWSTLDSLNPEYHIGDDCSHLPLPDAPTKDEYATFTQAAIAAGVITSSPPFTEKSRIEEALREIDEDSWGYETTDPSWCGDVFRPGSDPDDIPYDERFCQLLRVGLDDPYVVLLLALLPNLREIMLRSVPCDKNTLDWCLSREGFPKLLRFSVIAADGERAWPLAFFGNLVQSKELEILEIYGGGSWWDSDGNNNRIITTLQLPTRSLNVTKLVLQWCAFTYADMRVLIQACRTLKSFYYSAGGELSGDESITIPELLPLLLTHKETLEELALDLWSSWDYSKDAGTIHSLTDFHKLKRLETPSQMWTCLSDEVLDIIELDDTIPDANRLHHRLPPSLILLVIRFNESWNVMDPFIKYQIEDVIALRDSRFPELRALLVQTPVAHPSESPLRKPHPDVIFKILKYSLYQILEGTIFEQINPGQNPTNTRQPQYCWNKTKYEMKPWQPKKRIFRNGEWSATARGDRADSEDSDVDPDWEDASDFADEDADEIIEVTVAPRRQIDRFNVWNYDISSWSRN